MNQVKNMVKQGAKKLIGSMIDYDFFKWPPDCAGPFYQPERPMTQPQDAQADALSETK